MVYKRNPNIPISTEQKGLWVQYGSNIERLFVEQICPKINLNLSINLEKEKNPFAPDLMYVDGRLADLKAQKTPFFTAGRYNVPPQYAVTFNRKDYERYSLLYSDIDIIYWVKWEQKEYRGITVEDMEGVWRKPFVDIKALIESGKVPLHKYIFRQNDTQGNAKDSYIFDITTFEKLS